MEKGKSIGIEFCQLMDKYFFSGKEIDQKMGRQFREELNAMSVGPDSFLSNFIFYMREIFLGETIAPFVPERVIPAGKEVHDWALDIYTKGLKDLFDELFESSPGYVRSGIRKQDFVAFLCGINMNPMKAYNDIEGNYHNMAESREPILITGETGTGKELHAKLFHYLSLRRDKRFFALNCSGIPENLLESELFGYVQGAFTGAIKESKGILSRVGDGTLFLDEIGDMSPNLQAKILRVLETGDYYRVGGYEEPLFFQGRIIAATNKDLEAEILKKKSRFRPDLYYRISVFAVKLPPFRDLPIKIRDKKIEYIWAQLQYRYNIQKKSSKESTLSEKIGHGTSRVRNYNSNGYPRNDAYDLLLKYNYPGNYRELTNILKSTLLNSGGSVTVRYLPQSVRNYKPTEDSKSESVAYDPLQVNNVRLRDIISNADEVKRMIVEKRIELIYKDDKDLKNVLRSEGVTDEKDYQNINAKITRIVGNGRLKQLRDSAKKDQRF